MFDNLFLMMGPVGTAGAIFAVLVGVLSLFTFGGCEHIARAGHRAP